MGSIFGAAKKGFGMLKKSKDGKFLTRKKKLGGLKDATVDWEAFKRANRPAPGVPGTEKAKQKIASDWVKIRKRTKGAWKKKKLEKATGGSVKKYVPETDHMTTDVHERRKNPSPHKPEYTTDVHERRKKREESLRSGYPPETKRKSRRPRAGRPPKKRPRPMSTS